MTIEINWIDRKIEDLNIKIKYTKSAMAEIKDKYKKLRGPRSLTRARMKREFLQLERRLKFAENLLSEFTGKADQNEL